MTQPARIQRTLRKGQPGMSPGARYVGRGSRFGNPFRIGFDADDQAHATALFRSWVETGSPASSFCGMSPREMKTRRDWIRGHVAELRGLDLACWCPLPVVGQPDHCHARVLLDLANQPAV